MMRPETIMVVSAAHDFDGKSITEGAKKLLWDAVKGYDGKTGGEYAKQTATFPGLWGDGDMRPPHWRLDGECEDET